MARQMLMDNVYLTYIPSEKFKTAFFQRPDGDAPGEGYRRT